MSTVVGVSQLKPVNNSAKRERLFSKHAASAFHLILEFASGCADRKYELISAYV